MTDVIDVTPAASSAAREEFAVLPLSADCLGGLPAPMESPTLPRRLPAGWRRILRPTWYYLWSRVLVMVAAFLAGAWLPTQDPLRSLGSAWDGRWYLLIAQHGYPHRLYQEGGGSRWSFFPAFPAAIRGTADVTRLSLPDAAALVAFIFGLTATIALWLAVRELYGDRLADRSALLLVFFPLSCMLSFAYTEGLFLTAAAGAFYALQRRWWVTASLFACLACLTRITGAVVVLCVLVVALPAAWREKRVRPAVAAAIAPLGLAGFMAYSWAWVGTPLAFWTSERIGWGQQFVWFRTPVDTVVSLATFSVRGMSLAEAAYCTLAVVFVYAGVVCLLRLSRIRRVPASWWVYTAGTVAIAFSAYYPDSIPRYTMVAFPLLVGIAWKLRSVAWATLLLTFGFLQGVLTIVFLFGAVHPMSTPFLP